MKKHTLLPVLFLLMWRLAAFGSTETNPVVITPDGAWCWYQDERMIIVNHQLLVGSVNSDGDVQASILNLTNMTSSTQTLSTSLPTDDHNVPSFLLRDDGYIMAFYSGHGTDNLMRYKVTSTNNGDLTQWEPEQQLNGGAGVTYSNPFQLSEESGKIYLFFRGFDVDTHYWTSTNRGASWSSTNRLFDMPNERPYVKYASDNSNTIHFVYTEAHPDQYTNLTSIFHMYYRTGGLFLSDGTLITNLTDAPIHPQQGTQVYDGTNNTGEAWSWDVHLDTNGYPVVPYVTFAARDPDDFRYRYARWDGTQWNDFEIAYAGTRLYNGQNSYAGGIAVDPENPNVVYISSDVDITNGAPNESGHYELYRGETSDGGSNWAWRALTANSPIDNLRPSVPIGHTNETTVVWMRGTYTSYTSFDLEMVGLFGSNIHVKTVIPLPPPATDMLYPFARFDINLLTSPTEAGYVPVDGNPMVFSASQNGVNLSGTNNVAGDCRNRGGAVNDVLKDFVFNHDGRESNSYTNSLRLTLSGLDPDTEYLVRLHSHDRAGNNNQVGLWFQDTTNMTILGNSALIGATRVVAADPDGAAYLDVLLRSDATGRINLTGYGEAVLVILNGIDLYHPPAETPLAAFDVDTAADTKTSPGFASFYFDAAVTNSGSATTNGFTLTVFNDQTNPFRDRNQGGDLLTDFIYNPTGLTAEVSGLTSGNVYKITVHSQDFGNNPNDDSDWWLEEVGGDPVLIKRSQYVNYSTGHCSRFTFYLKARTETIRLHGAEVAGGDLVFLNGLKIAGVTPVYGTLGYEKTVLYEDALAYWKLNEQPGTAEAADYTLNNNPLLLNSVTAGITEAPVPPAYPGFDPGNTSVQFTNGVGGNVLTKTGNGTFDTLEHGPVTLDNQAGTVSMWIHVGDGVHGGTDAARILFLGSDGDAAFSGTALVMFTGSENNGGNQGHVGVDGGGPGNSVWGASDLRDTGWNHLSATWDGTDMNLYLNGNRTIEATADIGALTELTGAFQFGKSTSEIRYYGQLMDEVAVFERPLTPGEIQAQYRSTVDGKAHTRVLAVDIGGTSQEVQQGFAAFTRSTVTNSPSPQSEIYNGVTVSLGGGSLGFLASSNITHTMGDAAEDSVFLSDDMTVTLSGLAAGDYEIVLYSHDRDSASAAFSLDVDGVPQGVTVTPATGDNPNDIISGFATFTTDGGDVILNLNNEGGGTDIRLNGFELFTLETVPLPPLPEVLRGSFIIIK